MVDLQRAASWLRAADGLLVTAGAGMGVDSGLPDFRGTQGFWQAYPALAKARLRFEEIADPVHFARDPELAWGFYGHRLALYRHTIPHAGFALLRTWADAMPHGAFVMTSNVDGQFQNAGFAPEQVHEVHGSIHHLQCQHGCTDRIWSAEGFVPDVDADRCRLRNAPPHCPHCAAVARPNILMFGDWNWLSARSDAQAARLQSWLTRVRQPVVVELGAGTAIATVRRFSERVGAPLIRINPTAPECAAQVPHVGLRSGALVALQALDAAMRAAGG